MKNVIKKELISFCNHMNKNLAAPEHIIADNQLHIYQIRRNDLQHKVFCEASVYLFGLNKTSLY